VIEYAVNETEAGFSDPHPSIDTPKESELHDVLLRQKNDEPLLKMNANTSA
jgi:hypothetical protein